jgi:hypothetical protein
VDRQVAREAQEEVLAVRLDRLDLAPGELLGPAVGAEPGVRGRQLVGTSPRRIGRIRLAA